MASSQSFERDSEQNEARGAKLKLRKVEIAKTTITFLGMRASRRGFSLASKFIESVKAAGVLQDRKSLQSFIGLLNW